MPVITFVNQNKSIEVEKGTTLLEAARQAGVVMEAPCNGMGTCGKCKVNIGAGNLDKINYLDPNHKISEEEIQEGYVLACQSEVGTEDLDVVFESTASHNKTLKILDEGVTFHYDIDPYITKKFDGKNTVIYGGDEKLGLESGDTVDDYYGISIDIGTTTVVASLIDMKTGKELDSVSALNPQSIDAQDVLTRIKFASTPEGLCKMHRIVTEEFNRMIGELCKKNNISRTHIYEVIYSGNTTMIHLAGNRNPESLGKYPYTPVLYGGCEDTAKEIGLDISPFGLIYYPPIMSAYVGPDITSGLVSTELNKQKGTVILIDIGTNGEMMISKDGSLSATSTAAGPAFEGMNITFGMRAAKGAIEFFEINDDHSITLRTIENGKPVGICGSGLFDIVAELVRTGIITKTGRFIRESKLPKDDPLRERLCKYEGKPAFLVADGIYLTISDVRQVQLAKGAVRSGVEALMQSQGVSVEDVDKVMIAGSFGYHLQAKSLINITLLPKEFEGKIDFVGNTSKTGGIAFLLNKQIREDTKNLVKQVLSVELSTIDGYNDLFVGCLNFI
ncbi:MAG: ASKHA domain-containing protein [Lachnospiraceae bacterium]|nr:ASKHA domain-containing protein [Lachnospiraceae bacterium]